MSRTSILTIDNEIYVLNYNRNHVLLEVVTFHNN